MGCNRLLADGAVPACGVADVLDALSLVGRPAPGRSPVGRPAGALVPAGPGDGPEVGPTPKHGPSGDARTVLDALGWDPLGIDALAARTGLPPVALVAAVAELKALGLVEETRGHLERRGEGEPWDRR